MELETLYSNLTTTNNNNLIHFHTNLKDLWAEVVKQRDYTHSAIIPKHLKIATSALKNHPDISVRRADKSNMFVILDRLTYKNKLESIIHDTSKFTKMNHNPKTELKITVNKTIYKINKRNKEKTLPLIILKFNPVYLYGTVKTHKLNYPLRPIISQTPTLVYNTAKQLNGITTPYIPAKYSINSTDEFVQVLHETQPIGILAFLYVESLFTNVPVIDNIEIICNNVYSHPTIPPSHPPQ